MSGNIPVNKIDDLQKLIQELFDKLLSKFSITSKGKETISFTDATDEICKIAKENFNKIKEQPGKRRKYIDSIKEELTVSNPLNRELLDFSFSEGNLRSIYSAIGQEKNRNVGKRIANIFALYLGYQGWNGFLDRIKIDMDNNDSLEPSDITFPTDRARYNKTSKTLSSATKRDKGNHEAKRRKSNTTLKTTIRFTGICLACVIIFFGYRYFYQVDQVFQDDKNVILILPFDGDKNGNIQRYLVGALNEEIGDSLNIYIRRFDEEIDEGKEDYHKKALEIGRSQNVDIIIGGSFYTLNNVEYINPRITVVSIPKTDNYINQKENIPSFKIEKISLEKELVAKPILLARLLIGINHYIRGEYLQAVDHIELLVNTQGDDNILINEINTLIGVCYFKLYLQDKNKSYYEKASQYYSKAVEEHPESSIALSNIGALYLYEGMYDTAEYLFNRSVLLDPNNCSALMGKALVNFHYGRTKNLEMDFENIILLDPKNANNLVNFGEYWRSIDSINNAIFYYKEALSINPNLIRPKYLLAKSYLLIGDPLNAEKFSDYVFVSNPESDHIWYVIADVYYSINHIEKAISCLNKAYELDPTNLEYSYSISHIYLNTGKLDSAIYYCNKSIDIDSKNSKSWNLLASIYMKVPHYKKAKQCYLNSIKNNELNNFNDWFGLGKAYASLQKHDSAVYCFDNAIKIDSSNSSSWTSLGKSLCDTEEYEKALDCYAHAVFIDSSNIYALNGFGIVSNILGKTEEAISFYKRSLRHKPDSPEVASEISTLLYRLEKYNEAAFYLHQAVDLDPLNPGYHNNLGSIYIKLKDYDNAIIYIKKAIYINPELEAAKKNLLIVQKLKNAEQK